MWNTRSGLGLAILSLVLGLVVAVPAVVAVPTRMLACCGPEARVAATGGRLPERPRQAVRETVRALRILHAWDRQRAAAYAEADPVALRRLYAPASRAGARDVQRLRSYAERGLVVRRLTVQVLHGELLARKARLLRVAVEERVARAVATPRGGGRSVVLPATSATEDVVTMVRVERRWVVRSVHRG
jgi:hypothetical protein